MDKKFLKKYHLEEMQRRFQQINEYTFITAPVINEDDVDTDNEKNDDSQTINGMENGTASSGNENNDVKNDSSLNADNSDELNNADNEDEIDSDAVETTPMESDDEVIDVDDLTTSQEETEIKIDGVDDKLVQLLKIVNNFQAALDQNSKEIEDLKIEFARRNPTQTEKLNLRSLDSYPYSEHPHDFWANNNHHKGNYQVTANNNIPSNKEEQSFEITKNDVLGGNDRDIYKSMDYSLSDFIDI